jgi:trehalose/maltose hydrolase-like predicted phosphorylase
MGAMAGTVDLIQRGYVGAKTKNTTLYFDPKPNERLDGLSLHIRYRNTPVEVVLEGRRVTLTAQADGSSRTIRVGVGQNVMEIKEGESYTFPF